MVEDVRVLTSANCMTDIISVDSVFDVIVVMSGDSVVD